MLARTYQTSSEEETVDAGRDFAQFVPRPAVILLNGNLGAGKTTFTKGLASQLCGVSPEEVTSPTFTLIHDYGESVFHLDLYRIETSAELARLGVEDLLYENNGILIAEWGDLLRGLLPGATFDVTFNVTAPETREIQIAQS